MGNKETRQRNQNCISLLLTLDPSQADSSKLVQKGVGASLRAKSAIVLTLQDEKRKAVPSLRT